MPDASYNQMDVLPPATATFVQKVWLDRGSASRCGKLRRLTDALHRHLLA